MQRRTFIRTTLALACAASRPVRPALAGYVQAGASALPDVPAVKGDGGALSLTGTSLRDLQQSLHGRMLLAASDGYDTARHVLNPSIDRRPAVIVQPTGVEDVRRAVQFAREHALLTAVKCGGHSFSGMSTCNGGLMIDLSAMRAVRVDARARRAWASGGTLLGLIDHETAPYGLVTTMGTVSHTGVGGLTTGGGFGRLARRFGLALDNVTAVDVVTADGTLLHASADENPDLYWGVRGGGGNFGIVTGFEFQLHPMQQDVVGGSLVFPGERARDLLAFLDDYGPQAPDTLQIDFGVVSPPGGAPRMAELSLCYSGAADQAERVLAPIRKLGTPVQDTLKTMRYVALQRSGDQTDPRSMGAYLKSGFVTGFPKACVDAILQGFEGDPRRYTVVFTQQSGGAINRVASDATAFAHRDIQHNLLASVGWKMGTDGAPHMQWARQYWATLEPFAAGWYTNEVNDEAGAVVDANYRQNYGRLVTLKNRYDPTNLFRLNANVTPSRARPV
jgi:FAD/FMN-containing dehydrogenase